MARNQYNYNLGINARDNTKKPFQSFQRRLAQAQRGSDRLASSLRTVGVAAAGYFTISGITSLTNTIITSTAAQEAAFNRLALTIGRASAEQSAAFASLRQNVTTVGDEVSLSLLNILASAGGLQDVQDLNETLVLLQDISAAAGEDLVGLARQFAEFTRAPEKAIDPLIRFGIELSKLEAEQVRELGGIEGFRVILGAARRSEIAGQAEILGSTLQGSIARIQNAFGDLFEANLESPAFNSLKDSFNNLADALASPGLTSLAQSLTGQVLQRIADALNSLVGDPESLGKSIDELQSIISKLTNVINFTIRYLLPAGATLGSGALGAATGAALGGRIAGPVGATVGGIAGAGAGALVALEAIFGTLTDTSQATRALILKAYATTQELSELEVLLEKATSSVYLQGGDATSRNARLSQATAGLDSPGAVESARRVFNTSELLGERQRIEAITSNPLFRYFDQQVYETLVERIRDIDKLLSRVDDKNRDIADAEIRRSKRVTVAKIKDAEELDSVESDIAKRRARELEAVGEAS